MSLFRSRPAKIHFVGIGGIGMSGIAEVLLNLGYAVSGSDLKESDITRRLAALGGRILRGHAAANVEDVDVVVTSSAVRKDNPEVVEARRRKIPLIPRAEMLAELMRLKYGVAIAGSHGKTTTTSMAAHLLAHAGLDPTAVVGGKVNSFGSNAKLGKGDYMVVEADESDGSFLHIPPTIAIVTNIDPEHLDHWRTEEALRRGFLDFVNRVPFYGRAILCIDHPTVQSLLPEVESRYITYGEALQADYRADRIEVSGHSVRFEASRRGEPLGRFEVAMVGRHNALNALAVIALGDEMGVPADVTRAALASFGGVQRRFTVRGEARGVTVVDDYGHHPAEVKATLRGAREAFRRRVVCLFQPHRRRTSSMQTSAISFAAWGAPSRPAARAMRSRRAGSVRIARISSARRSPVRSRSSIIVAAPASTRLRAFMTWWLSAAKGKGTRIDGFRQTVSSARVVAPARQTTRSAAA